jgi:polysaccharide export outer membrane protein
MISLPLLNDLQAAGRTPMELQKTLIDKLTPYMPKPEVSVIVQEIRSFRVSVIGEVKEAGRYEIRGPVTVLDMLAQAGGLSEFASSSKIVILRAEAGTTRRIPFNYSKAISRDPEQDNFYLQPGDIVVVP